MLNMFKIYDILIESIWPNFLQIFAKNPQPVEAADQISHQLILWRRIEAVITSLTRNQVVRKGTWVRIPPSPPANPLEFKR